MKETSQILSVNGLRMHVMTAGEGPAVLLMHGFPDTTWSGASRSVRW